jgi:hypothetical protein
MKYVFCSLSVAAAQTQTEAFHVLALQIKQAPRDPVSVNPAFRKKSANICACDRRVW